MLRDIYSIVLLLKCRVLALYKTSQTSPKLELDPDKVINDKTSRWTSLLLKKRVNAQKADEVKVLLVKISNGGDLGVA